MARKKDSTPDTPEDLQKDPDLTTERAERKEERAKGAERDENQQEAKEERIAAGTDPSYGMWPRKSQPVLVSEGKPFPAGISFSASGKSHDAGPQEVPEDKGEPVFGADSHPTAGAEASQAKVVTDTYMAPQDPHHNPSPPIAGVRTAESIPRGEKQEMFEADLEVQRLRGAVDSARRARQTGSERTDNEDLEEELKAAQERASRAREEFQKKNRSQR
jgi:hypothetical protein